MELLTQHTQKHLLIALMNSEALVSHCGKQSSKPSPCWTVQRGSKTKINSRAYFVLLERKVMFCKNIYPFSHYYYNFCMTFMFNCWLTGMSKMSEGRKQKEEILLLCPYSVLYSFGKQALCKCKSKLSKFAKFSAFIFIFFYICRALNHKLESFFMWAPLYLLYSPL